MNKPFIATPGLQYDILTDATPVRPVHIVGFTEHGAPLMVDPATGWLIQFDLTKYGRPARVAMSWGQID